MNLDHMRRLLGWRFNVIGIATLKDYELGVDLRGYFNIRAKVGASVKGVLYEIDQYCLDILDELEAYPDVFNRIEIYPEDSKGKNNVSWVYIQDESKFNGEEVKSDFLKRVLAGATENHLPKDWIKFLETFKEKVRV